jgi:hypothetical protein
VLSYALQVVVPSDYHSPADQDKLLTMFLAYIPTTSVSDLASQIKAKNSAFYTGSTGVAQQIAEQVDSSFSVTSAPDPNAGGSAATSSGSGGGSAADTSGAKSSDKRQDAIIGVVSALGGVTLIVLALLVFRSLKRRRELAHERLGEEPDRYVGARPDGQEFDRDSVGGQRRRSFYFAEDSLRGFDGQQREEYDHRSSPAGMRQRVGAGAVSAPILRENTMNF